MVDVCMFIRYVCMCVNTYTKTHMHAYSVYQSWRSREGQILAAWLKYVCLYVMCVSVREGGGVCVCVNVHTCIHEGEILAAS